MNRFTRKTSLGYEVDPYTNVFAIHNALGQYEDAEEAGLLVRLPCKVGDTLYTNKTVFGWHLRKVNPPFPVNVYFIGITEQDIFFNVDNRCGYMAGFKFSDIGKTIYLTKEEAEQALKDREAEE